MTTTVAFICHLRFERIADLWTTLSQQSLNGKISLDFHNRYYIKVIIITDVSYVLNM